MTPAQLAKSGTEHAHQKALFAWAAMAGTYGFVAAWNETSYASMENAIANRAGSPMVAEPRLHFMFAIANGGFRNKVTANKLKAEGVKSGVPDIMLPVAVGMWHGLFIELKKFKGRPTPQQVGWLTQLNRQGYRAHLCEGWEDAAKTIQRYIGGQDTNESTFL